MGRVRGQEHQFNAFRNFQILGDMPARAVEHQDDVLVGAGTRLGGERRQERAERFCQLSGREHKMLGFLGALDIQAIVLYPES